MIRRLAALILLSTLSLVQTADLPHQVSWTVLELGDNFTLSCTFNEKEVGLFFWYKLKFGYMVQTVAEGTYNKISLQEQFDKSRFSVTKVNAQYVLDIRNVSKEDEATYFCQAGAAYRMKIINGTLLAVNDFKNQRSIYVKQSPETESVQPGDSVTLQCSLLSMNKENRVQCPGEHSVHWFRSGSGKSSPGIIYTHNDEQEERSCVYSLSKTIQNSSDAGTYYCAVATCGEILFGEGTKVETRPELYTLLIVVGTLLGCCVIVIAALLISRNQKPVYKDCKGEASNHVQHDRSAEDQPSNDGEAAVNYIVLDFPSRGARRWKNNRELPQECLYSGTRDPE
ncbi:uncharacterized protein LOC116391782 isoform X2 [Anarrhichthys ocellatus]|uniref:uncharacterized protein LOC116391782 isoform X2 n=1 Tax=Anarrhichthys ocellatus TaxID=433405 RepID=UPI0012EE82B3|nr:uncharacterized protein LOC116391782 isoform X2 [Anarrhichthys ocellatus]